MQTVEVSNSGKETGTVSFRGLTNESSAPSADAQGAESNSRLYRCTPKQFVPKDVARRIADQLSSGANAGSEDGYEWHTKAVV